MTTNPPDGLAVLLDVADAQLAQQLAPVLAERFTIVDKGQEALADIRILQPPDGSDTLPTSQDERPTPLLLVADAPSPALLEAVLTRPRADIAPADPHVIALRLERLVVQRAAERERARLEEALARTSHQLERFAYTASHDLKEPLRAVTGFSRLLETRYAEQLDEQARVYLGFITDGAERLAMMITALIEFSTLSRHELSVQPVDLAAATGAALESLSTSDVEVVVGDLPTVMGDPTLLGRLLLGLLDNAVKFARPDTNHRVEVQAQRRDGAWELRVSDNGVGVSPGDQERIFDMFSRLHTRERYPGHGIGLAIAAMIATRLRTRVEIASEPDVGTTMSVLLHDELPVS